MSWGTYGDGSEFNGRRKGKKGKKRKKDPFIAYFTSWIMMMHHRRTKKIEETRNHAQETESINFHPGFLVRLLPLTGSFLHSSPPPFFVWRKKRKYFECGRRGGDEERHKVLFPSFNPFSVGRTTLKKGKRVRKRRGSGGEDWEGAIKTGRK